MDIAELVTQETEKLMALSDAGLGIWRRHNSAKAVIISDMKDEYLQSAIAMIKRGYDSHGQLVPKNRDLYLPALVAEAIRRGLVPAEDGWDA